PDQSIHLVFVFGSGDWRGKSRVVKKLGLAHDDCQTLEHRLGPRRDVNMATLCTGVEGSWCVIRQAWTRPPGDHTQLLESWYVRLHEAEGGFVQRSVNDLPASGTMAIQHGHRCTKSTIQSGDVIS